MAKKYLIGVYPTENEAVSAIKRLLEVGYENNDISVLAKNPERFEMLEDRTDIDVDSSKAVGRAAGAGAATGGIIGGIGGLLLSIGTLAIPGIGPFLAAGPIAATLGGIAAGGAAGGLVGALAGMGIEKSEAKHYEEALERGDLLVLVEADETRYDRVNDIFLYPEDEYYRRYERGVLDPVVPFVKGEDGVPIVP
ncbi:MAG: hypothetical protein GX781_00445, partial [Clostridiales bacterium]|nr:hypothetical protein [Clostridiales bacterium]